MVSYQSIENEAELNIVLASIKQSQVLLLDTEFVRVSTYYPKLGLLQLHVQGVNYLIDPVSVNLDSLWALLFSNERIAVFHSCKEDLDVLLNVSGQLPGQLFDTQVAAAFLGYGPCIGYGALVEQFCQVSLAKDQTLTDWLARPLTPAQCQYAAADVSYLGALYERLAEELHQQQKWQWFQNEMQSILSAKLELIEPDELYKDIGNAWQLKPQELATLKLLAAWRYRTAVIEDRPLSFVLKEETLMNLAKFQPVQESGLAECGVAPAQKRRYSQDILSCIQEGKAIPQSEWPEPIRRIIDIPAYKADFKHVKQHVAQIAKQHQLPDEMMGSRKLINQFLMWRFQPDFYRGNKPKLLTGWRHDLLQLDQLLASPA